MSLGRYLWQDGDGDIVDDSEQEVMVMGSSTEMEIGAISASFCKRGILFLEIFSVSFDVLHHEIFPRQFVMIREMVDDSGTNTH